VKAADDINNSGTDYADGYIKRLVSLRAPRLFVQQHNIPSRFCILYYALFLA